MGQALKEPAHGVISEPGAGRGHSSRFGIMVEIPVSLSLRAHRYAPFRVSQRDRSREEHRDFPQFNQLNQRKPSVSTSAQGLLAEMYDISPARKIRPGALQPVAFGSRAICSAPRLCALRGVSRRRAPSSRPHPHHVLPPIIPSSSWAQAIRRQTKRKTELWFYESNRQTAAQSAASIISLSVLPIPTSANSLSGLIDRSRAEHAQREQRTNQE